jgi:hypothetical protein
MPEPLWVRLIEVLMPGVTALLAFLMGKATKGAANQQILDALVKDVAEIKERQVMDMQTLASHSTLHDRYDSIFKDIANQLRQLNTNVSELIGQLRINR